MSNIGVIRVPEEERENGTENMYTYVFKSLWEEIVLVGQWLRTHLPDFLVVKWIRFHLPMQETWVWFLVQEDSTYLGATKFACHNYWARLPGTYAAPHEKPPQWETQALQWEVAPIFCNQRKPMLSSEDPAQPKNKIKSAFQQTLVKNPPATQETPVWFLGREGPLEEGLGCPLQYSWASLVA